MQLGKRKMFFVLNGLIAAVLCFYFMIWIIAPTATGSFNPPYYSSKLAVSYTVDGITYTGTYLRNDIPYEAKSVSVHYLSFAPSYSRINSFMGIAAEPLAWWLVFLLASSMLLFTNNVVFSKGTSFHFHRRFPWVSMNEYFALPHHYAANEEEVSPSPPAKKALQQ